MTCASKLDRIDLNILVQLQKDGAQTNLQLAEKVGLSASPCLQRVKRLESAFAVLYSGLVLPGTLPLATLIETLVTSELFQKR